MTGATSGAGMEDPSGSLELLHDIWIKCVNISTITITMSQDTLTSLITAVMTISIMQLGYFLSL